MGSVGGGGGGGGGARGDGYEIDGEAYEKQTWLLWDGGSTAVPDSGVAVFSRGKCLNGDLVPQTEYGCEPDEELGLPATHVYGQVDFVASRPQWVGLYCPGDGPDRTLIDGTFMDQEWPGGERGRAWCYAPETDEPQELNDQPEAWLPALDDAFLYDDPEPDVEYANYGTPGETGPCLPEGPPPPVRGEILFTEVIVAALGLPEWIEVANVGPAAWSLAGCTLGHVKVNDAGAHLSSVSQYLLGAGGGIPELEPGERWILSKDGCHDGSEADGCSLEGESTYSGFTMANDGRHELWLECPGSDERVEEMIADPATANSGRGVRDGHSMFFEPDDDGCTVAPEDCNDVPEVWCEASFEDWYAAGSNNQDNYGTPWDPGICSGDDDDDDDDDDFTPPGGDPTGCFDSGGDVADEGGAGGCDCMTSVVGRGRGLLALVVLAGACLRRRR